MASDGHPIFWFSDEEESCDEEVVQKREGDAFVVQLWDRRVGTSEVLEYLKFGCHVIAKRFQGCYRTLGSAGQTLKDRSEMISRPPVDRTRT